jgi:hypothetical protein
LAIPREIGVEKGFGKNPHGHASRLEASPNHRSIPRYRRGGVQSVDPTAQNAQTFACLVRTGDFVEKRAIKIECLIGADDPAGSLPGNRDRLRVGQRPRDIKRRSAMRLQSRFFVVFINLGGVGVENDARMTEDPGANRAP